MSGAFGLDGKMVKGVRLVNLDTEDWGDLFIGCAGGGDTQVVLPAENLEISPAEVAAGTRLRLSVRGLLGGHSGINIGDDRGNAVILAARLADAAAAEAKVSPAAAGAPLPPSSSFLVVTARGGDKRNALAREASMECWFSHAPSSQATAAVLRAAVEEAEAIKEEYGTLEKDIEVSVEAVAADDGKLSSNPLPLDARTSDALLTLLLTLPHGVIKKSHTVAGLVETSTNLASVIPVVVEENGSRISSFKISCSTRSSFMPALEATRRSIARIARGAGANVEQGEAYPGWAADPDAPLVALAREAVEGVTGRKAHVGAIHAGLECGLIKVRGRRFGGGGGDREKEERRRRSKLTFFELPPFKKSKSKKSKKGDRRPLDARRRLLRPNHPRGAFPGRARRREDRRALFRGGGEADGEARG